jgi:hypothetical protein
MHVTGQGVTFTGEIPCASKPSAHLRHNAVVQRGRAVLVDARQLKAALQRAAAAIVPCEAQVEAQAAVLAARAVRLTRCAHSESMHTAASAAI